MQERKRKACFEEKFREVYDGTFASVEKFIDRTSDYLYENYKKAKIKPIFITMLKKKNKLSDEEFLSFLEISRWLAVEELFSYDEMKQLINEMEAK